MACSCCSIAVSGHHMVGVQDFVLIWRRFKWKYRIKEWNVERFFPGLLAQYKFKRYSSARLLWSRGLWDVDYLSSGGTVKMDCWSFSSSFLISHSYICLAHFSENDVVHFWICLRVFLQILWNDHLSMSDSSWILLVPV